MLFIQTEWKSSIHLLQDICAHRQLWLSCPVCASPYFSLPPDSVFTRLHPKDGLWNLEWMCQSKHPLTLCKNNIPPFYWVSKTLLFCYTFDTVFPPVTCSSLGFNKRHKTALIFFSKQKQIPNCPWMTPLNEAMTQVSFVSCPGMLSFDTSTSLVMLGGNKQVRAGISQNLCYLLIKRPVKYDLYKQYNIC